MSDDETVQVDPVDVFKRTVDDYGRVSVGTDLSGEQIRVAVLSVVGEDGGQRTVTLCTDCLALFEGPMDYCRECGSEAIRQAEPQPTEGSTDD